MSQHPATVTSTGPLMIVTDASPDHPVPCLPANYSAAVGTRLLIRVRRSGLVPIVLGPL